ncbi:MAG: hypothetical protein ACXWQZ_10795, partial [Ktedonobacterales bacterium]
MPGRKAVLRLPWRARWDTVAQALSTRRLLICGCLALVLLSGGSWATFRLVRRDVVDWQHANVHVLVQTDV